MRPDETIAAIATPPGAGGIGIIRVSGFRAIEIVDQIFSNPGKQVLTTAPDRTVHYGTLVHPDDGTILDEVLVTVMRAPRTYTREDVVEIGCHGGMLILKRVLEAVVRAGARPAAPGEFTRRAFLNGRIDLTQAEAVADLVNARSEAARRVIFNQLRGGLAHKLSGWRNRLIDIQAEIETAIDFPDEELPIMAREKLGDDLAKTAEEVMRLASTYREGGLLLDGARLAIVGRPNVGKSSLLNALSGEDRAIVTEIPGTTRDVVESRTTMGGIPVVTQDTAGIREEKDRLEREGIARSRAAAEGADLLLVVLDGSESLTMEDGRVLAETAGRPALIVVNKTDLPRRLAPGGDLPLPAGATVVKTSALTGEGIAELKETIVDALLNHQGWSGEETVITHLRHRKALEATAEALSRAAAALRQGISEELVAVDLKEAGDQLGTLIGPTTPEEVLDVIFSRFCIGK